MRLALRCAIASLQNSKAAYRQLLNYTECLNGNLFLCNTESARRPLVQEPPEQQALCTHKSDLPSGKAS